MRAYKYFDTVTAVFVATLLLSNIASSAKIIDWGISFYSLPLAFDAGTLVFPFSYIFGDVLTEVYGYARARKVIWTGFVVLVLSSAYLWLVSVMPGEAAWQTYAGDQAFLAILGSFSNGGIVLASLIGYLFGEFSNSYVLAKIKVWMNGNALCIRTIVSTAIGQAIDTSGFVLVACSLWVFPWEIALSLMVSNYIFKVAIEILFTPLTYRVVTFLKKGENEDFYDRSTNFNPLAIQSE